MRTGFQSRGLGLPFRQGRWVLMAWVGMAVASGLALAEGVSRSAPGSTSQHWAFQPLLRTAPPGGGHPVDAFVDAALAAQGLQAVPAASDRERLRRATLDLTGLPPSPGDVALFESDPREDRWSRLLDRLLSSPAYGERWGRHWLDAVRYTESAGFEYDRLRDQAWPYRDYVIASFNADKPYDVFLREQVAGDVLEPVTREGLIATGMLVCGPYDQAGNSQANATQRAITREEEMEDILSVVGQTMLGLTVNCARCHDHKFDPIPLLEYYRLKAVFDGVKHGERPLEGTAERRIREARVAAWEREIAEARARVAAIEDAGARAVERRRGATDAPRATGPVPFLQWDFSGPSGDAGAAVGSLKGGARMDGGGLVLSGDGAYFESEPLGRDLSEKTLEAWVSLGDLSQGGGGVISVETRDGSVFDAIVYGERKAGRWMAGSSGFARTLDLEGPAETAAPGEWIHVAAVYGGDNSIAFYRNGQLYGAAYTPSSPRVTFRAGQSHVVLGMRHQGGGRPWLRGAIRRAALHDRALGAAEVAALYRDGGGRASLEAVLAVLTEEQRAEREVALGRLRGANESLEAAKRPAPAGYVGTRVQPAPTRVYKRGDVKTPGDVALPGAISVVSGMGGELGVASEAPEGERRRAFAAWLTDPRNPLPARVMVNRIWQHHFGQGLVSTPNDFGAGGARPSHRELLDWLAVAFVESGWSVKAMHRWIMTSAAYGRSSRTESGAAARDSENQWYWRFQPRRLEAEALRDAMLWVSGELNREMGGASFRPFTTSEYGATFYHPFDSGEPRYNRRTVYRMNVNSGKEPLLDSFDCPDPSIKTPKRGVTTTPLQALGLMNNPFVQRQAATLAARALRESGGAVDGAVGVAYQLVLARAPTASELERGGAVARGRGLQHLCWALLNSTEFLYVR